MRARAPKGMRGVPLQWKNRVYRLTQTADYFYLTASGSQQEPNQRPSSQNDKGKYFHCLKQFCREFTSRDKGYTESIIFSDNSSVRKNYLFFFFFPETSCAPSFQP